MYYEEEIIDGVLMWRGSPDGEWEPVKGVSEQYQAQKVVIPALEHRIAEMEREVQLAQDAVVNAEKLVHAAQTDYYKARRRIAELERVLREATDDLESEIEARRPGELDRRIENDLDIVREARALLTQEGGG